jgi:crossover junction endodeoxyribonuclease RuvC
MGRLTARQMWTAKLEGKPVPSRASGRGSRAVGSAGELLPRKAFAGLVLGIDPSLRGTGLALVDFQPGKAPVLLRCATVRVPARRAMALALAEIHRAVSLFIDGSQGIRHVALEQTIYVQNFQTAQILGAARGAAIAAAAIRGLPVFEYPPLRMKQAVAGSGRASKEQLARTVMAILGHGRTLAFDEADAAGVALCHAFTWRP